MTHRRRLRARRARPGGAAPRRPCSPARADEDLRRLRRRAGPVAARRRPRRRGVPAPSSRRRREEALDQARARLPADVRRRSRSTARARHRPACWSWPSEHEASADRGRLLGRRRARPRVRWAASATGCCTARTSRSRWRRAGFRCKPGVRVARVTAAYGGSHEADELVVAAAGVAARVGRRRCAWPRSPCGPRRPVTAGVGVRAEEPVIDGVGGGDRGGRPRRPRAGRRTCRRVPRAARGGDRARRDLGGGARGRGVGRRRRARRRLERGRPRRAGLPRLARLEDRPQLARAGRRRAARGQPRSWPTRPRTPSRGAPEAAGGGRKLLRAAPPVLVTRRAGSPWRRRAPSALRSWRSACAVS